MAYITFEEEEAVKIACTNNATRQTKLLGSKMLFNSVRSPTDIIWENINKKKDSIFKKHLQVFLMITLIVLIQSYIVYQISSWMQNVLNMFPQ